MKTHRRMLMTAVGLLIVVGCGVMNRGPQDGSMNANANANQNMNSAANANMNGGGMQSVAFDEFVRDLLANTADDAEPVDVDALQFTFDEDDTAFDDLLTDDR